MKGRLGNMLKNGGLFLLLLALTIYMVLKDNSLSQLSAAVRGADIRFLLLSAGAMGIFLLCEGINITRCLGLLSETAEEKVTLGRGVKYALVGFFFSSVTPSASGGQPMQLYFMHRDGIQAARGTLALLFELLSFQIVTISLALLGYFYQRHTLEASMGNLQYLLLAGVTLNVIVMVILICAVFSKKMVEKLMGFAVKVVEIFSREKSQLLFEKMKGQIVEYQNCAVYLKQNKAIFGKTLGTTLIQLLSMYAVPFFVYKSFGLSHYTAPEVMALQAVLYVAVSALPLPGALGVSESAFMILFKRLFSAGLLPSAMLLSRGISFYLFVLISGISVAVFMVKKGERKETVILPYKNGVL